MKIEPSITFVYYVHFDAPTLSALVKLGCDHYDGHCRQSAEPRGFISNWKVSIAGENGWSPVEYVTATWREIDTCLKILEMTPRSPNKMYTEDEILLLLNLSVSFHKLLNHSKGIWDDVKPILDSKTEF